MRHKWLVMLVAIVTTLTTTQEALKQYDGLKAQAATWATLRVWTSILGAYAPPDEPLRAQQTTCHNSEASAPSQQSFAPTLARTIRVERVKAHRQEPSSQAVRVELLALDEDHHEDSVRALDDVREVALLTEADRLRPEKLGERSGRPLLTPADMRADLIRRSTREVRVTRPGNRAETEAAPLAEDENHEAALRQSRAAARAEAQKRAIKRALKVWQMQFDKATKQELSRAKGEVVIELPHLLHTALDAANSIAAQLPLAPPQPAALPALPASVGGCAGE